MTLHVDGTVEVQDNGRGEWSNLISFLHQLFSFFLPLSASLPPSYTYPISIFHFSSCVSSIIYIACTLDRRHSSTHTNKNANVHKYIFCLPIFALYILLHISIVCATTPSIDLTSPSSPSKLLHFIVVLQAYLVECILPLESQR